MIRAIDSKYARSIPIIALTANVYNDFNLEESGINDILIKPFKERDLLAKLDKYWSQNGKIISINGKERIETIEPEKSATLSYDLSFLTSTSGSNPDFVKRMVQSFIQNNWDNIVQLNKAMNENDLPFIKRHAHKVIPSYRYLQIKKTEAELKLLEKLAEEKGEPDRINELIAIITEDTHHIINLLSEEAEKLGSPEDIAGQKNFTI